MSISKAQLRAIRQQLDVTRRLTEAATHPDAGAELVIMTAAAQATLALDVLPGLLDELERLQAARTREVTAPPTAFIKFDGRGGHA